MTSQLNQLFLEPFEELVERRPGALQQAQAGMGQKQGDHLECVSGADITNRELSNKLTQKNEITCHFLEDVCHELRTPLSVIKEFASIIRDGLVGPMTDEQREYLDIINRRADDLASMLDDMLDTSRLDAGLLEVCRRRCTIEDILEKVRPILERKASAYNVNLTIALPSRLPFVFCDPKKVGRIIVNLAVNVIKTSKARQLVRVWCNSSKNATDVNIGVTNRVPGTPSESISELFERLTSNDDNIVGGHKKSSLGLTFARELVQLNFGDIFVESRWRENSTFLFTIPTMNLRPFLERYWHCVQQFRDGLQFASLVRVCPQSPETAPKMELEAFLQRQIRCSDLLLPADRQSWSMVVASSTPTTTSILQRVDKALEDARNRRGKPLPQLHYQLLGTWRIPDDRTQFLNSVEASVGQTHWTTQNEADLEEIASGL